jgi:hypothetical protein
MCVCDNKCFNSGYGCMVVVDCLKYTTVFDVEIRWVIDAIDDDMFFTQLKMRLILF